MKRNFSTSLVDLDGKPYEDKATLKTVCLTALVQPLEEDRSQTAEQKLALYTLAKKVNRGGVVEVTAEELTTIKTRVGKMFGVLVVGLVFEMLDTDYVEYPAEEPRVP